ncbi:MAG: response regulator [Propionivibrio sp.]
MTPQKTSFPSRSGIAYRTAWIVAMVALLVGALSLAVIGPIAHERSRSDALSRLQSLVDTVANTTSAACFVEDETLATDVANGLLKNSVVSGVVIRTANKELANVSRLGERWNGASLARANGIVRAVYSPFDGTAAIGEIAIIPNQDELTRLSQESLLFTASVLVLQLCAIALATIYVVFRWIVLPIKTMSDRLHQMSEGSGEPLAVPHGHDASELGRLVGDINELTSGLARAKDAAEQASRSKGEFLATMSHEIRTPINAVVGMAYLALKTDLTEQQRDYVEKIRASGGHLLDLVNDVLDFAKIESGKLELELAVFNLDQLIERVASIASLRAKQKSLSLDFHVDPAIPRDLEGDSLRIGQILLNYINNAIKFTASGFVEVRASLVNQTEVGCRIRFEVADSGIGLTEEQMSRLFGLFQQGDASTTRKYGGTGLGLAIARQLAELMGGAVGVRSTHGVGSTFWAVVHVGVPPAGAGEEPERVRAAVPHARHPRFDGARILLAEDNLLNQQIAREMLEDAGAAVTLANDGKEAIDLATAGAFDCILMDVRMPGIDGLQATQALRGLLATAGVPIIAMTANAMVEDREECLRVGMNDFIPKPVNPEQFLEILGKWIAPSASVAAGNPPDVSTQPADSTPHEPHGRYAHIDLREISKSFRGNAEQVRNLIDLFLDTGRKALDGVRLAHESGNAADLKQIGHRFKSSSKYMGAYAFSDLMLDLENGAREGAWERIALTIARLDEEWRHLEGELDAAARAYASAQGDGGENSKTILTRPSTIERSR